MQYKTKSDNVRGTVPMFQGFQGKLLGVDYRTVESFQPRKEPQFVTVNNEKVQIAAIGEKPKDLTLIFAGCQLHLKDLLACGLFSYIKVDGRVLSADIIKVSQLRDLIGRTFRCVAITGAMNVELGQRSARVRAVSMYAIEVIDEPKESWN